MKQNNNMILTEKQLCMIDYETNKELLYLLYKIEDRLNYKYKKVSNTIDYLQTILNDKGE